MRLRDSTDSHGSAPLRSRSTSTGAATAATAGAGAAAGVTVRIVDTGASAPSGDLPLLVTTWSSSLIAAAVDSTMTASFSSLGGCAQSIEGSNGGESDDGVTLPLRLTESDEQLPSLTRLPPPTS